MKNEILKQRAKAFDYLFDAVVVTDLLGVIVDWNKGSEQLYGYTKEQAIGQRVSILHVPEDTDHVTSEVILSVEKVGKWTGEVRMLHKDGRIGWIESMCVPIFDENEKVIGALGVNRDITDRVLETERLNKLANFDQLTKIANRYMLIDNITRLIAQSKRYQSHFALLFVDLNNFKSFNDNNGHAYGDKVLKATAGFLKKSIRSHDTVARIGGDEFVILLENLSNTEDTEVFSKSLIKRLKNEIVVDDESVVVNCSIGVAIYPNDGVTTDELLAVADKKMYEAKLCNNIQN
jgi:diguanylate cyclase (GGDEF)-like protein/PAS domain S-box-containing protein